MEPFLREWGAHRRPRRPPLPGRVWAAASLVALAAFVAGVWLARRPHPWRPPSGGPAFAPCTYGGYVRAWCADLAAPARLHVAVLPATERPARGALFYLEGGPGGAATAAAVRVDDLFARVERTRDVVLVDQRGTGGSEALACPPERVPAAAATAVSAYVRRCFQGLGGRARLDTTAVAADDLDAVRRLLGYGPVDVYGGSYGATLAQAFLRRHPSSVRTAVLDSGSLVGVPVYEREAANAQHALAAIFARCRAQAACRRAFPRSSAEVAAVLARGTHRVELTMGPVLLTSLALAWTIEALSQTAEGAATLPLALHRAARGDYTDLALAYAAELGPALDGRSRLAMFWTILCGEPWARQRATVGDGSYLGTAVAARARVFARACRFVPAERGASTVRAVPTHVPVLLLAGSADPLDPPANLAGWRRQFPAGKLVVVPGAGHGTIEYGCVQVVVARFVARGSADGLDASCVRRIALPSFETG